MKRQRYLKHRLQTLAALHDAVGAMRSLSAHHFRRARQALAAARLYRNEMDTVIAEIGIHQPLHAGVPAGMLSAGFDGVGHFTPLSIRILPIEPVSAGSPLRRSPYVDSTHLTMVAVREFLYITLYEILLDALAAEHGMRLMATQSAQDWLEDTTTTTSRRLASARCEASTQELLDLASGGRRRMRESS